MNRRSFLKNSIGALLLASISTNKVLSAVVNTIPNESLDVLLYAVQTINGDWKIKGCIWPKLAKQRLSQFHYNLDTFKALEVVDNSIANTVKEKYWKEYNCKGRLFKNINYLQCYKNGINARETGQLKEAHKKSLGATHRLYPEYWKEHGKKIGNLNKENGHMDFIYENYGKFLGKNYGKLGADKVVREKLGIHSACKEDRKKWASMGGKIGGKSMAKKYDMKSFSKLGNDANIKKHGKPLLAHNLLTHEIKQFDSIGQAEKYCNVQSVIITKILRGLQPKTRTGWVFNPQ